MKVKVIAVALLAAISVQANEWIEKFYPGLEAGGKVNFLEKGYLGKEKAIEIVYASGLAKFGVARDVSTDLKGVVDWTVSAMVSGDKGSVAAAMEFFDAQGLSLKLDTGRSYGPKSGIGGKETWSRASWKFTSPKKAVRASVHLLSTGKVPVRFAQVNVKSAQGVDRDEMPFNVIAWPVAWNPDWHGGEPDMVNFSDAPIPVTFALFGEQDEVKDPAFEIVMPEGLVIRDAFCANYHDYGREEPTSSASETFAGVACRRYRFENPIATRCLKRQKDHDRLYGITMVIAPKDGKPASGDYVIGYRVTCNGKTGVERTFKMKYQPLPKGLRRAPNFQVFSWTDQDRNFSRDDVYADSMRAFAAAGLVTKHLNGIYRPDASYAQAQCESKRATEIVRMIKRDYPEAIISYELQDLWCPFNCRLPPDLAKEVAAHMSKTIDAAHMHKGRICPQYFATSKKLHDHLRDNVIIADLKRFGVRDGDWVELDMEPWECQTWCFCDDCLKAFAEFCKLDHVPTIEEAGADPDKWADFRTSQSMQSTRLLAETIHAYNPEIKVVDYDYILDYGNVEAEKKFRRDCAKDAFKNEKWLDGHLASYYHTIGKAAFDAIRNNVRYLKKPYYPMGGLTGYGGYLRPGEVLDDKQFRQLGLAAFVNGCPGWAFYNGTCFDGRQIIAMMRVQDDVVRYGHLPWGKVDGKTVPTCDNPLFAHASTVDKDGTETVALFNYDRNESITVRLDGYDYTLEPSDVRFVTLRPRTQTAAEVRECSSPIAHAPTNRAHVGIASIAFSQKNGSQQSLKPFAARDGIGHVMAKIRAGKEIGVAYFGGSITQMDGWRRLTHEWLSKRYPQAKFREINAAIGGTGSDLGVFRVGKDVISEKPDLVFVEFATNDSGRGSEEIQRNFDGIVRQIWTNDPETDIVFVYTVKAKNLKNYLEGRRQPAALAMEELAEHYGIPSVDWGVEVAQRYRSGKLVMSMGEAYTAMAPDIKNKDAEAIAMMKREGKTLFAKDGVHPALPGHEIYVSELASFWQTAENLPPVDHRVKGATACFSPRMERAKIVPIDSSMLDDGWESLRDLREGNWDESQDGKQNQEPYFSSRAGKLWKTTRTGATLTFQFQGNYCAIYDLLGPGCGIAEVTVDGKRQKDVARFDGYCSYYRLGNFVVFDGEEGLHEVKIVRSATSPAKAHVKNRLPGTSREKYRPNDLLFGSLMIVGEMK